MNILNIYGIINNKSVYFREDFDKIRILISNLDKEIYLDFKEIENFSPSSAHEFLSLLENKPNLKIINLNQKLIKIIRSQIKLRNMEINLEDYFEQQIHQVLA